MAGKLWRHSMALVGTENLFALSQGIVNARGRLNIPSPLFIPVPRPGDVSDLQGKGLGKERSGKGLSPPSSLAALGCTLSGFLPAVGPNSEPCGLRTGPALHGLGSGAGSTLTLRGHTQGCWVLGSEGSTQLCAWGLLWAVLGVRLGFPPAWPRLSSLSPSLHTSALIWGHPGPCSGPPQWLPRALCSEILLAWFGGAERVPGVWLGCLRDKCPTHCAISPSTPPHHRHTWLRSEGGPGPQHQPHSPRTLF